jgi:hypothetical protein
MRKLSDHQRRERNIAIAATGQSWPPPVGADVFAVKDGTNHHGTVIDHGEDASGPWFEVVSSGRFMILREDDLFPVKSIPLSPNWSPAPRAA